VTRARAYLALIGTGCVAPARKELNADPQMPARLRDRQADNWRPLIAIADAFGADWATRAREAAVIFAGEHQDEDAAVVLLRDIRDIFDGRGVNRLPSGATCSKSQAIRPWK
jgi:hypothetical protein